MKAVVKWEEGEGKVRLEERPKPIPGQGQVLIKVAWAGICGTDLKIRSGDFWCNPPVTLGHEYSGIVEEIGPGVTDLEPGDPVVSETAQVICGKCEYCLSGNYLMCNSRLSIGYGTDGAFADYIVVRSEIVHRIPQGVTLPEAALCEPAAVALHAVFDYAEIRPHHEVLVFGPGTIGILVAQAVRSMGARAILCGTAQDGFRLEAAAKMGIDTVDTSKTDLKQVIDDLSESGGVDYAFDCSGAAPAISQALNCLKKKGTLVQVGITKPAVQLDYGTVAMKELSIRGAFGHRNENWSQALKLMSQKKMDVKPMITDRLSLPQWEQGFDRAQKLNSIKVLLSPQ